MTAAVAATPTAETLARLERGLATLGSWLTDRETLATLARRSGHELPPASWRLLEYLDARGPLRVSDVAACHGVRTSSVVPRLQALEDVGLIHRGTDRTDARVSMIGITAAGRSALAGVHEARREALAAALEHLDAAQLAAAADVVVALAERLAAHRPPDREHPPG